MDLIYKIILINYKYLDIEKHKSYKLVDFQGPTISRIPLWPIFLSRSNSASGMWVPVFGKKNMFSLLFVTTLVYFIVLLFRKVKIRSRVLQIRFGKSIQFRSSGGCFVFKSSGWLVASNYKIYVAMDRALMALSLD